MARDSRRLRVYFDVRCLQDPNYQFRGIGSHVSALLRTSRKQRVSYELIGLTDPALDPLPAEYAALLDQVSTCWNPSLREQAAFVNPSPMTHDPVQAIRFQSHPAIVSAAVVHDFIPLDRDGYFAGVSQKIDYFAKLSHLKSHDLFMPVSEYSGQRLRELLGVDDGAIRVTGASVRNSLYSSVERLRRRGRPGPRPHSYFFTLGGGDRRKNTEVVIRAVWMLRLLIDEPVRVKVVGHYGPDYIADLNAIATEGGSENFIDFCPGVSDDELVELYAGAIATVSPSHIEGFSLPVVEASVCGSPTVASTCAAHLEFIDNEDALFPSSDADVLCRKLKKVYEDRRLRATLIAEQQPLAARYHEDAVGRRFWEFLSARTGTGATAFVTGAKPKIAFLTPYPPDASGVARFSEATLSAARKYMDIDLYTNAERPVHVPDGVVDAGQVSPALFRRGPYESVVSVIGNSHFHLGMFDIVEQYGGPCILHDSRLTHIYHWRMGRERFSAWAEQLLKRPVTTAEIDAWLYDQSPPSLFIEPVLERASPLIVHTRRYRDLIQTRYGRDAQVTTFPPNMQFSHEELSPTCRGVARRRCGVPENVFAIASFGFVGLTKGLSTMVTALDILRSWGIPAELYLVGSDDTAGGAHRMAAEYGVEKYIHTHGKFLPTNKYRDYMLAADAAIQLRMYDFGQPSAALADCISAGLPAVANDSLAESCDAPGYVARIHNHVSPLLVAEQLANFYGRDMRSEKPLLDERGAYLAGHNFDTYAQKLVNALRFE